MLKWNVRLINIIFREKYHLRMDLELWIMLIYYSTEEVCYYAANACIATVVHVIYIQAYIIQSNLLLYHRHQWYTKKDSGSSYQQTWVAVGVCG